MTTFIYFSLIMQSREQTESMHTNIVVPSLVAAIINVPIARFSTEHWL